MSDPIYDCKHFSQKNPKGPGQGDVPALLRRVADTLETMDAGTVLDITFNLDVDENGTWPGLTVYLAEASLFE